MASLVDAAAPLSVCGYLVPGADGHVCATQRLLRTTHHAPFLTLAPSRWLIGAYRTAARLGRPPIPCVGSQRCRREWRLGLGSVRHTQRTSAYMNRMVKADFPTAPSPTITSLQGSFTTAPFGCGGHGGRAARQRRRNKYARGRTCVLCARRCSGRAGGEQHLAMRRRRRQGGQATTTPEQHITNRSRPHARARKQAFKLQATAYHGGNGARPTARGGPWSATRAPSRARQPFARGPCWWYSMRLYVQPSWRTSQRRERLACCRKNDLLLVFGRQCVDGRRRCRCASLWKVARVRGEELL